MDKYLADLRCGRTGTGRMIPPPSPSVPSHVNPPQTPADVQTTIQQFQQSRQALMNQLESATEEQRQAILGELEQLREQMRDQLDTLRQQAQDQAQQMQSRFGNDRGACSTRALPLRRQRPERGWPAPAVRISPANSFDPTGRD